MLFCFWLEKFKDFVRDFLVQRQRIEIRAGRRSDNGLLDFFRSKLFTGFRLGKIQRWRYRWERKAITVLENSDVIDIFLTRVADFQKICFQQRNSVREGLRQWPMQIAAQGRVQRILKNMREFPGNFRKSRKPIAYRRSTPNAQGRDIRPVRACRIIFSPGTDDVLPRSKSARSCKKSCPYGRRTLLKQDSSAQTKPSCADAVSPGARR